MVPRLKIPHPHLKGYNQEFEDNVRPDLIRDEPERRRRVRLGLIFAAILTPPSIWFAWYFGFAVEDSDSRAWSIAVLGPLCGYLTFMASLMKRTKNKLMRSITSFLNWSHTQGEDKASMIERLNFFGLLPDYDAKFVSDVLRGLHENWPFEMCEISLSKIEGWGRNRRSVTKFAGLILTFDLGRVTPAVTLLTRSMITGHPKKAQVITHERKYEDHLGEVIVRSSDIYAIETVMCDRFQAVIQELTQSLPDINVSCLIDRHYLHIPLQSNDRFEMDLMLDNMGSSHRVQKLLNEFSEILTLLDIVLKRRACPKTGALDYPQFRTI